MDITVQLEKELDVAQNELAEAEVALIEALARAEAARSAAARLEAAVAALNGESPPPAASNGREAGSTPPAPPEQPEDPLAGVKCQGCGQKGRMSEQLTTTPGGATVRMLVCGKCGNQVL